MASPDLVFQEVVAVAIKAALPGVRSGAQPPYDGKLPYIQFGESDVEEWSALGNRIIVHVHIWDNAEGPHNVKNMQASVFEALQKCEHTRGGFLFTAVRQENARAFLDENGETWHGVQRFRALASNIAA